MQRFPEAESLQTYLHSLSFIIKVNVGKSRLDGERTDDASKGILLDVLFKQLMTLAKDYNTEGVRFSVSQCKLDTAFQSMMESTASISSSNRSNNNNNNLVNHEIDDPPHEGGYIHESYIETEMIS